MARINVLFFVESRYKVDRKRIVAAVKNLLKDHSLDTSVEVSVAIVGDRKMRALNIKYRNLDKTSNVLSFPTSEGEKIPMPGTVLRLGDVVISYPEVIRESAREEWFVDDRIEELVLHGVKHLLGIHHA